MKDFACKEQVVPCVKSLGQNGLMIKFLWLLLKLLPGGKNPNVFKELMNPSLIMIDLRKSFKQYCGIGNITNEPQHFYSCSVKGL